MSCSFELTKEFHDSVTSRDYIQRRLVFAPELPDKTNGDFLSTSENGILELLIVKQTLSKIFKECFPTLQSYLNNKESYSLQDDKALIRLYYMTIGLLLTTHEHHSVINIHEKIVFEIIDRADDAPNLFTHNLLDPYHFFIKEVFFLQSILNSNNNKLNKSSSLWTLFKKLFVRYIDSKPGTYNLPELFFFKTAFKSAKLHTSNYYAWNFIRFILNASKLYFGCHDYITITKYLEEYCKSHANDASAWTCFVDVFQLNTSALKFICAEYNRYSKNSVLYIDPKRLLLVHPSSNQVLKDQIKWLWDTNVTSEVPYLAFKQLASYSVGVWKETDLVREMFSQIEVHCALFEELQLKGSGIQVTIHKGYMTVNIDTTQDYALHQKLESYYNWKKILNWYEKFLKEKCTSHDLK